MLSHIFIFLKDLASHLVRLEAVFQKLEQAGLKLKPSKCKLLYKQITYLGHIMSAEGTATNEGKEDASKNWSTPTTVTEVHSFLGFVGYYHFFIPKFAQVAWPPYELMSGENMGRKKATVTWNDRCQQAFDELKCLCTMVPIFASADFSRPFKLHTNACGSGLGAVLYHIHDDGTDAVIAYATRSLTKAEMHIPPHKVEFHALKWAVVEKFHGYLYGLTIIVYTNKKPLTYILMMAKLDTASCTIEQVRQTLMQTPCSGCPGPTCVPNTLGTHH